MKLTLANTKMYLREDYLDYPLSDRILFLKERPEHKDFISVKDGLTVDSLDGLEEVTEGVEEELDGFQ